MANESLGASFTIDVTNLKAGLADANRAIRESESEFKAAAAGLDDWTKSEEGLNAKIKSLNDITAIQKQKVEALKNEYQKLIDNGLDPTSREAVELRTQINKEEAALASNEKELRKQEDALNDVGESADDAGSKFENFGDMAKAAAGAAAAALAAAGAAAVSLVKSAVEGYAEYEQLVGGVDTLFGDASQKLQDYAANAYKTAGMSANDYMSNVTSFSAALISSLGGDTDAAADVADRAMRDMSDNANKMGTDMQSIVDTYQSLAKGNFQMLDNLKLGYGGTKTEMERLIADASKMTDVMDELGISVTEGDMSFSNMINAISVVQTQMGITGTTAKEAASTIQGSIGMMSTSWSNLVTGMADENANIDLLMTNFIDSVGAVAENLLPRINVAVDGLLKVIQGLIPQIPPMIAEFLPTIIEGISGLMEGVVAVFPSIVDTVLQVLPMLLTAIIGMLPDLLTTILDVIVEIINALSAMLPEIVEAIIEVVPLLIDALVAAIPDLLNAAITFLMAIVQAIPTIITALLENLPHIITTIINALVEAIPQLVQGAIQLFKAILQAIPVIIDALIQNMPDIIDAIITGLIDGIGAIIEGAIQLFMGIIQAIPEFVPQIIAKMPEIIQAIVDGLANGFSKIVEAGGELVKGIWEGIKGAGSWLWEQISGWASGLVDGVKKFFGIASPSKLFADVIGKNMALGIGVGFMDAIGGVNDEINNAIKMDEVGINARVAGVSGSAAGVAGGKSVVVYQTNNYSQAHSRYEIYKSKQQTVAALQLALAGV